MDVHVGCSAANKSSSVPSNADYCPSAKSELDSLESWGEELLSSLDLD